MIMCGPPRCTPALSVPSAVGRPLAWVFPKCMRGFTLLSYASNTGNYRPTRSTTDRNKEEGCRNKLLSTTTRQPRITRARRNITAYAARHHEAGEHERRLITHIQRMDIPITQLTMLLKQPKLHVEHHGNKQRQRECNFTKTSLYAEHPPRKSRKCASLGGLARTLRGDEWRPGAPLDTKLTEGAGRGAKIAHASALR